MRHGYLDTAARPHEAIDLGHETEQIRDMLESVTAAYLLDTVVRQVAKGLIEIGHDVDALQWRHVDRVEAVSAARPSGAQIELECPIGARCRGQP